MENKIIVKGWKDDGENMDIIFDYGENTDSIGISIKGRRIGLFKGDLLLAIKQLLIEEAKDVEA